jgi:hypothetical protein
MAEKIGVGWRWIFIIVWTGQYCLFAEYCSANMGVRGGFDEWWARGAHPTPENCGLAQIS